MQVLGNGPHLLHFLRSYCTARDLRRMAASTLAMKSFCNLYRLLFAPESSSEACCGCFSEAWLDALPSASRCYSKRLCSERSLGYQLDRLPTSTRTCLRTSCFVSHPSSLSSVSVRTSLIRRQVHDGRRDCHHHSMQLSSWWFDELGYLADFSEEIRISVVAATPQTNSTRIGLWIADVSWHLVSLTHC